LSIRYEHSSENYIFILKDIRSISTDKLHLSNHHGIIFFKWI